MKREILDQFQGKENVIKITSDSGTVSYLTQIRSFDDETYALGACKLNTIENDKKHVLFLFNSDDEEVGRYYLGKSLQGKTPAEIVEIKHNIGFYESWNPESEKWVPCVGVVNNPIKEIASKAVSFDSSSTYNKTENGNVIEVYQPKYISFSNIRLKNRSISDTLKYLIIQNNLLNLMK